MTMAPRSRQRAKQNGHNDRGQQREGGGNHKGPVATCFARLMLHLHLYGRCPQKNLAPADVEEHLDSLAADHLNLVCIEVVNQKNWARTQQQVDVGAIRALMVRLLRKRAPERLPDAQAWESSW